LLREWARMITFIYLRLLTLFYVITLLFCSEYLAAASRQFCVTNLTRRQSVAAGFGRHGMPPPASDDTGSACFSRIKKRQRWDVQTMWACDLDLWPLRSPRLFVILLLVLCQSTQCKFWWCYDYSFSIYGPLGQHSSNWSRDLATLTFDLGGRGACGWWGSLSSIRIPSLKFVGLAIRKTEDMAHDVCQH